MRKSKIVLLFKILIVVLLLLSVIKVVSFNLSYKLFKGNKSNRGTITFITKKSDYTVINIKSNINYKAYIYDKNDIDYGDIIYFEYQNKEVTNNTIPNIFNYKNYLKSKNINQVITISRYKKLGKNNYYKFKGVIYKKILSRKSKNYILTFLCGDKSYLDNDIKRSYTSNGISHLLCISGFHIMFVFSFLKKILRYLCKNENVINFVLIVFSILYLVLTSFMIALFRSILMYFLNYFNKKYNININSLYYFFIVLFLSISLWPNLVFDVGFYYTFILSFFLTINKFNLNNLFKVSLYCFIISLPLTIYLNYNFNLLSIIYSTLSVFIVCYIIYPLSFFAIFFKGIDLVLYEISFIFETINLKINNINFFKVIISKTNIYIIIIIYIIYLIYIYRPSIKYSFLVVLISVYMIFNKYFDGNTYVYFIDVKQGDMTIIVNKHFKDITLIDTGGTVNDGYLKYNIRDFLYSIGVSKINNLIISHGDYDHIGEAINLVNNFKVEKVIFNCGKFNDLEQELIKVLDKKKILYYSCIKELNIDNNKLYFLQTKKYDNENDNSNVIYTELDGYKFMFMGDASTTTEKEIMNKYNLPNIDVLKVGHHGSKTSSGKDFINVINPAYSVISVGKNNRYGHPNKEVLETLNNSKIYRIDQDGSIMFTVKDSKLKIETCSP